MTAFHIYSLEKKILWGKFTAGNNSDGDISLVTLPPLFLSAVKALGFGAKTVKGPRPLRDKSTTWKQSFNLVSLSLPAGGATGNHLLTYHQAKVEVSQLPAHDFLQRDSSYFKVLMLLCDVGGFSCSPFPRCLCRWHRLRWSYCDTCRYEHRGLSCYTWQTGGSRRFSGNISRTKVHDGGNGRHHECRVKLINLTGKFLFSPSALLDEITQSVISV